MYLSKRVTLLDGRREIERRMTVRDSNLSLTIEYMSASVDLSYSKGEEYKSARRMRTDAATPRLSYYPKV